MRKRYSFPGGRFGLWLAVQITIFCIPVISPFYLFRGNWKSYIWYAWFLWWDDLIFCDNIQHQLQHLLKKHLRDYRNTLYLQIMGNVNLLRAKFLGGRGGGGGHLIIGKIHFLLSISKIKNWGVKHGKF